MLSTLFLLGALHALVPAAAPAPTPADDDPTVFVLGIDGMDPTILQRLIDEGRMPHFAKLAREGTFQQLGTSNPPQSPVAWSNFVTGMNPGGHGIYDFLHLDRDAYLPISSAVPPTCQEGEVPGFIDLFGYIIPLGGEDVVNNRSGTPFWDTLHEAGVKVEVYRMPGNYPPTPSEAFTLSGMGTVDMKGSMGDYTWYTNEPIFDTSKYKAHIEIVNFEDRDGDGQGETVETVLLGPPNVFKLEPCQVPSDEDYVRAPVTLYTDTEEQIVLVRAGADATILRVGEWSDWLQVDFELLPMGMMNMSGAVRFYLRSLDPYLQLYASPVNINPLIPAQPVTTPDDDAAIELAESIGIYYTQGMPEEVNALKDGFFDDDDYETQVKLVRDDGEAMLHHALAGLGPNSLTFMYLSDIDLQCHMLWRHGDPKTPGRNPPHPAFDAESARVHADDIEEYYTHVDGTLGEVVEALPDDATLVVMSDHGFQPYRRELHLNSWLRDEGYLALEDDKTEGKVLDVDWDRTRAFGVGFNGLYLNLRGRESRGIVDPAQADALLAEISDKLLGLVDEKTGMHVVSRVYTADEAYTGERADEAPDLVIGYNREYGCSDPSVLLEVGTEVLTDNTSTWSGNHLMDPAHVPGILLVNRKLQRDGHDLTDVTASLLDLYGIAPTDGMVGTSFFD